MSVTLSTFKDEVGGRDDGSSGIVHQRYRPLSDLRINHRDGTHGQL